MEFPSLDGKLIGLVLAHAPVTQVGMVVLERARLETVSGRGFVTGFIPKDDPDSWVRGLPAGVAWEFVGYYLIFDSYDEYKKRLNESAPPWWRRLLGRTRG
jgi:hypothetical protein